MQDTISLETGYSADKNRFAQGGLILRILCGEYLCNRILREKALLFDAFFAVNRRTAWFLRE